MRPSALQMRRASSVQPAQSGLPARRALVCRASAAGPTVAATGPTMCSPDELVLKSGEVSAIDRKGKGLPADVFRCFGCTDAACQGPSGCAKNQWRFKPDGYLREILTARVYDVAIQTPLEEAKKLSEASGNKILLKREDLQPVFSFKLRGAFNKMSKLTPEELARGVITASAGNHAQGVALAASRMGCKAVICMPVSTPDIKIANVKRLGGIVDLAGASYNETQSYAVQRSIKEGLVFVPPYDDPYTIAGQGTIGDEILRQVGDPDQLDAIFVPVGGGGLAAGVAAYIKALKPGIQIIGVEPAGANSMTLSLAKGERIALSEVDAFADGVAVKQVGMETFRLCRELLDGMVLVSNSAISAAIKDVFNETRSILEPAGAVALAGAKAWLKRNGHKGKTVVAVTSGANINFERLRLVSELANVGAMTEATLTTAIPERPGAFRHFIETVMLASVMSEAQDEALMSLDSLRSAMDGSKAGARTAIQVTEFKYRFSADNQAQILWGAGIRDQAQLATLMATLNEAGLATEDISNMASAQLHLRHLVGGRARSFTGALLHERMYLITFPEAPGALMVFLSAVSPKWNVTLFHYRSTGSRESSVLLGVQVPPAEEQAFAAAVATLPQFAFKELGKDEQKVFARFIT